MDRNRMAALLEDRLAERERDQALAHLSVSDEDAADFADAAATLRELEEEDGVVITPRVVAEEDAEDADPDVPALVGAGAGADVDPDAGEPAGAKVIPLRPPSTARRWRRPPARWLGLAAVIVGVLVVLPVTRFGGRGAGDPGQYAALLANQEAGLPPDWTPPWASTRGSDVAAENARAVRLGATHMDLEVAVAARQRDEVELRASRMEAMLGEVVAGGAVSSTYGDIGRRAGEPPEALAEQLAEARKDVAMLVGEDYFNLGAWAEAARIAAHRRDAGFFRAGASRKVLDRAASMSSLDENERSSVEAIRAAIQAGDPLDWAALGTHTHQLLGHLGGNPAS